MGEWGVEPHSPADLRSRLAALANLAFNRPDVFALPKISLEVPEITAVASPSTDGLIGGDCVDTTIARGSGRASEDVGTFRFLRSRQDFDGAFVSIEVPFLRRRLQTKSLFAEVALESVAVGQNEQTFPVAVPVKPCTKNGHIVKRVVLFGDIDEVGFFESVHDRSSLSGDAFREKRTRRLFLGSTLVS